MTVVCEGEFLFAPQTCGKITKTKTNSGAAVSGRFLSPKKSPWPPGELDSLDNTELYFSFPGKVPAAEEQSQSAPEGSSRNQVPAFLETVLICNPPCLGLATGGAVPPVEPLLVWAFRTNGRLGTAETSSWPTFALLVLHVPSLRIVTFPELTFVYFFTLFAH